MAPTTAEPLIKIDVREKIMGIQINRPAKKNALTGQMYTAMARGLTAAQADGAVHVVVLHGTGDCFTSGNDLNDFLQPETAGPVRPGRLFLDTISTFEKPIVAAVNGPAVGIGTTLLLHCDLVYAAMKATFQLPFVNLGLCPEGGSSLLLPRTVGYQRAAELLLLGEAVSANMAWEYGLVNNVYPDDQLLEKAFLAARNLASRPLDAVCLTKRLLKASRSKMVAETIAEESRHFSERLRSPAFAQACEVFFARRHAPGGRSTPKRGGDVIDGFQSVQGT